MSRSHHELFCRFPELMRIPLEQLTDEQVIAIFDQGVERFAWMLQYSGDRAIQAINAFEARARDILERRRQSAPPPATPHPYRLDTEQLRAFAQEVGLDGRRRQVFERCIERGMSLQQCADDLGISRETVRSHLRQIRSLERLHRQHRSTWGTVVDPRTSCAG